MPKVILDAGHGGSDIGEYYGRRSEKNDNLRLAFRVGKFLEERGIDIGYIRTSDQYLPMMERVAIADKMGGDLLVSLHRSSCNTLKEEPGLDFFVGENDKLGEVAAYNIGRSLYDSGYMIYETKICMDNPLINDTDLPSIVAVIGYIQLERENDIHNNHFVKMAHKIAEGIYKTLVPASQEQSGVNSWDDRTTPSYHYRISMGPYRDYNVAFEQQYVISRWGYETEIMKSGKGYFIYVGEFRELDEAISVEFWLRRCGFCTLIIRV